MLAAMALAVALAASAAAGSQADIQPQDPCEVSTQFSALDDHQFAGTGDKIIRLNLCPDLAYIAAISHDGSSNFVVRELEAGGDRGSLLVNEIGSYEGVRLITLSPPPTGLEVRADGEWNVLIRTLNKAPTWNLVKAEGNSDAVLQIVPALLDNPPIIRISHDGESNFVVHAYGKERELLVNQIGGYHGEVLLPPDTVLIEIIADGKWTLEAVK